MGNIPASHLRAHGIYANLCRMTNMPLDDRAVLLGEIETYLASLERPIAETTFGRLAVNDGKFVSRLRARKNVTVDRIERCRAFIRSRPADAPKAA